MPKVTYSQIQSKIRAKAWDKYSTKHGISEVVISVIVPILVAFLYWYIFREGWESVIIALAILGIFFIVYSVFYLGYFYREYVSDYNSLGDKIQELENKLGVPVTDQGIEISPYIEFDVRKIGLQIYNSTFENTSNLKVELIRLTHIPYFTGSSLISHSLMIHIEKANRTFEETKRLNKHGGVDKQDYAFVYLAEVIENAPVFLLEKRFSYENYERVMESEKSINSRKQEEPAYTGYDNHAIAFEIELLITAEKINSGQLIKKSFKGNIYFLEMIRQWIHWHDKWTKMDEKPVVEISLDIVEIKSDSKNVVLIETAT